MGIGAVVAVRVPGLLPLSRALVSCQWAIRPVSVRASMACRTAAMS